MYMFLSIITDIFVNCDLFSYYIISKSHL